MVDSQSADAYTVTRESSRLIRVYTEGALSAEVIDTMFEELKRVVGVQQKQVVLLEGAKSAPAGVDATKAAGHQIRTLYNVSRFAISGVSGAKGLIFRMLTRFVGDTDAEIRAFKTNEEALTWLEGP